MIALNDAEQILQRLRTGQIDWKQKGLGSGLNPQRFNPPTTWTDFSQAYISHTMRANAIEIVQLENQEYKQGGTESCATYGT